MSPSHPFIALISGHSSIPNVFITNHSMAQLAIINAPYSFTTIWSFIRPWLAKETLAKIDVLGADYKDVLLSQIDAENLPTSLGGTCTCEEHGGCKLSNAGPWMHGREERRAKWLRGERKRLGLGMEGEDEDEELEQSQDEVTEEQGRREEHPPEEPAGAQSEQGPEDVVEPSQEQPQPPQKETRPDIAATATAGADTYGKSTEVVDSQGDVERTVASPESSPESTSGPPTPSTFEDARSDTSARSKSESARSTGSEKSTGSGIRSKLKLPLPKIGLGKKKSHERSASEQSESREPQMGDIAVR